MHALKNGLLMLCQLPAVVLAGEAAGDGKALSAQVTGGDAPVLAQNQGPANAQQGQAGNGQAAQHQPGFALEEITVTARRVEENLQDTPVSISAFSGTELEERQIFSTDELDQITPNLQFTRNTTLAGNNASSAVFIRGIGQTDPTSTVDPGVGLYIDDVYMGQSVGGTLDFRDIASVQVLRGPQGTLFGRNTVGGAIVLTTTQPGDTFGGTFRMRVGDYNLRDAFFAVDVPGRNNFRSRFTFGTLSQEGYVTRVQTGEKLGDANTYTATGKFLFSPSDALRVEMRLDYTNADENGNPFVFAASDETATFQRVASADAGCPGFNGDWTTLPAVPLIDDDRCANDFQNKGPYANNGTYPLKSELDNWGGSVHVIYNLNDAWALKSITAYRKLKWQGIRDADNTPLTILHTSYDSDGDQSSEELQFLFSGDRLTGVAGLYYFQEDVTDIVLVELNPPPPGIQQDSDNNITQNSSWAAFTQWTFDINDRLAVTVGERYTEDTKGSIPDQFNYAAPDVKYLPVQLYEDTFDASTGSATLSYRWSDAGMVYLSYSEGFKGGGWNSHFNRPQTPEEQAMFQEFGPEEANTTEVGVKLDIVNNKLRLNGAVFTSDYTDLQFTYRVGVAPYLANAGKASIDGYEIEATWVPTPAWLINGSVGHLDTRVDELQQIAGTGIGVAVGNKLPFSPNLQASLGIAYSTTTDRGTTFTPRLDVWHQDRTYFDANNTVEIAQLDPYTAANVSLDVVPASGDWRFSLGVNNATDELYPVGGNSSLTTSSGYAEIAYARPREYFVGFQYNF